MNRRAIVTHEEHGEVLETWRKEGLTQETLVYFDRHLDLKCIGEMDVMRLVDAVKKDQSLSSMNRPLPFQDYEQYPYGLDNFLYAAIRFGFWNRVVWVYPSTRQLSNSELGRILWRQLSLMPEQGDEVLDSFQVTSNGAEATIAGTAIIIATVDRLSNMALGTQAHVDFDLDYFGTESGQLLADPRAVARSLQLLGLPCRPPTLTYSISSGFMPEHLRWIGDVLAQALGYKLTIQRHRCNSALSALRMVACGKRIEPLHFWNVYYQELSQLGGAGASLASVLALQIPDLETAERQYFQARDLGDCAHWAAYAMGMYFLKQGDYSNARKWFMRAQGKLFDTLQNHALCLEALCSLRLCEYEDAYLTARRCMDRLPLRREPCVVAAVAASKSNNRRECETAQQLLQEIDRVHP